MFQNYNDKDFEDIKKAKAENKFVLVIMRGPSGIGKTTFARELNYQLGATVISADDYFQKGTKYKFDANLLKTAHGYCRKAATDLMQKKRRVVVIDNTNINAEHFEHYVEQAKKYDYVVHYVVPNTPWAKNVAELRKHSCHHLTHAKIEKQLKNFEQSLVQQPSTEDTLTASPSPIQ